MATVSYVHMYVHMSKSGEKDPYRALSTHLNVEMATPSRGEISCTVQKTVSVKKKNSDKILRRFDLAKIIFKYKKKDEKLCT